MIPAALRREVVVRADNRCEYCGLSQLGQEATFHVDHITPLSLGGPTTLDNLALACVSCSLRKGSETEAVDPTSSTRTQIFNPRLDLWSEDFRWDDVALVGITPCGRATMALLKLNRPLILAIREEEKFLHRHPPVRVI